MMSICLIKFLYILNKWDHEHSFRHIALQGNIEYMIYPPITASEKSCSNYRKQKLNLVHICSVPIVNFGLGPFYFSWIQKLNKKDGNARIKSNFSLIDRPNHTISKNTIDYKNLQRKECVKHKFIYVFIRSIFDDDNAFLLF